MNKKSRRNEKGSVLILMTLIMVVASMYITTALFDVRGTVDQERLYKTKKQLAYLQTAVADYRTNNRGRQLASLDELLIQGGQSACVLQYVSTYSTMQIPVNWCGPYIDISLFLGSLTAYKEDAWGTAFQLSASSASAGGFTYTITSCGENTTCGDGDDLPTQPF